MSGDFMMKMTTLCYIDRGGQYLMMHRTKKVNDENHDKWIGVGGKFEDLESPEDCMLREIKEETGLTVTKWQFCGIITFVFNDTLCEYMHLFKCTEWTGELTECNEGELEWIPKKKLFSLPMWEGDRIFLSLMDSDCDFFSLKLRYRDDTLLSAVLNGKEINI